MKSREVLGAAEAEPVPPDSSRRRVCTVGDRRTVRKTSARLGAL